MVTIIGAGPIGCYIAYLLAKAGKDVEIFEEHYNVGKPVQCAGLVTAKIFDIIDFPINKVIVNRIKKAKIISANKEFILQFKRPDIVLDREKFDKLIAKKAVEAGANLYRGYKFLSLAKKDKKIVLRVKNLRKKRIEHAETDILIGADGPLSRVAAYLNKKGKRQTIYAAQARVRMPIEQDMYKIKLNYPKNTKLFTWLVPESANIARVGLGAKVGATLKLKKFLYNLKCKILEYQGGLVPLYSKIKVQEDSIYVVGDAACQVKASTGGGIVPGLQAAKCLAKAILEGKSYEKELKSLDKELSLHLKIRKIMNKFSDHDFDMLLELSSSPKVKRILESFSRDGYRKKAIRLLLAQKKLLLFARKFF